jgi:ABC-type transport system involved in cytochrome c biogenesis permease subunit
MTQIIHMISITACMLLITVMMLFSFFYWLQHRQLKHKKNLGGAGIKLPSLEKSYRVMNRLHGWSIFALTVASISGIILAHAQWGDQWMSQPKMMFALSTWFYFLAMWFFRRLQKISGIYFFSWMLIGYLFLTMTMYGAYAWG